MLLSFHAFVDAINARLDDAIFRYRYPTVWFSETVDQVEWRRESQAVRLSRHSAGSARWVLLTRGVQDGSPHIIIMNEQGVVDLIDIVLHATGVLASPLPGAVVDAAEHAT